MAKLTDEELISICDSAISQCIGQGSELSSEREVAMDRYLGAEMGNEVTDRSQIRTREVLEIVEKALPSLMRLFALEDNAVVFEPEGVEDQDAARQETDVVRHVFWQLCDGYQILFAFAKDGLISKNGIVKTYWRDDLRESRESYRRLLPVEREALLSQEDVEVEVVEESANPDGTTDLTVIVTRPRGLPGVMAVPPEEFGVSRGHRSLDCDHAPFVYHRTRKTLGDLVGMGFSRQKVQSLSDSGIDSTEAASRYYLEDDQSGTDPHWSMREVWVTECYPLVDRDDDGVPERLKVLLVGSRGSYTLLDVEEVDEQPFVAWSPVPLTHKFAGLSLADLVVDLQETKTQLTRGVLDNLYLANNGRTAINERVDTDDMLVSRPGSLVRTEGYDPPASHIYQFQHPAPPPQVFEMLGYLDQAAKTRTGVGDAAGGLDLSALSQINTGVAAMALDASRLVLELIARNLAEHGLKPLFRKLHALLRKQGSREMVLRLRNQWVPVTPQEWRERENLSVRVGVGTVSREQRAMGLTQVLGLQEKLLMAGLTDLVSPENLHAAVTDLVDVVVERGSAERYFTAPGMRPPAQAQPDAKLIEVQQKGQIEAARIQVDQSRLALDARTAETGAQLKAQELALREREAAVKAEVEQLKASLALQKTAMDERSEVLNAQAEVMARAQEARSRESQAALEALRLELEAVKAGRDRAEARYEAELKAAVEVLKLESQRQAQAQQAALGAMQAQMADLATRPTQALDLTPVLARIEEMGRTLQTLAPREPAAAPVINLRVAGGRKRMTLVRGPDGAVLGGETEELDDDG